MNIVILTGAGISVASGLPTYRGPDGLYQDDIVEDGKTIAEILDVKTLLTNPELTKKYITKIRDSLSDAKPNELHHLCTQLEQAGATIFTQNIDDLHEQAGALPYKLHGTADEPVLFGMNIPEKEFWEWHTCCYEADMIIVIGTSCQFPYLLDNILNSSLTSTGQPVKIIVLDPDPDHILSTWAAQHQTDPEAFSVTLQVILEDLEQANTNDNTETTHNTNKN